MALLVYMTAASADEAERIAGDLVESRLAACVNVMAPIRSIYSWKGELCRSEEIPFIAKTDDDRFEALAARVRALHSYETPCIVALPVARGDADFLAWITESTHPAFDRIMSFNGAFADHILADKLHILNVSFLIDGLVEKRGGCAGNIAYTLALMGEKPLILATAGKNFSEYGAFLESKGISLEGVRVMKDEFTASCTLITDKNNNQINGFHPAAMGFPCEYAFPHPDASADWGIVSPGNLDDMKALPRLFREKGIRYIYDPGQQIPALSGDDLLDAITGSALLVTNDYELEMISKATQRTRAELRALTGGVITTLGEQGSVIDNGERGSVGIAAPKTVADPTGAGDSFRSGLLKGLLHGLDVPASARLGATCASYCIEHQGTQEHVFTYEEFAARHRAAFHEEPGVKW